MMRLSKRTSARRTFGRTFRLWAGRAPILLLILLPVGTALGWDGDADEENQDEGAPLYTRGNISLIDAVRMTLEHVPSIKLKEQDAASKQGAAQEATGQFDFTLVGNMKAERTQEELTEKTKKQEQKQRDDLRRDAKDLLTMWESANQRVLDFENALSVLNSNGDLHQVRFTNAVDQADWNLLVKLRDETGNPNEVDEVMRQYLTAQASASSDERDNADTRRKEAEKRLRELGGVPKAEWNYSGELNMELRKKFRTGPTAGPFLQITNSGTNYVGKPRAADYGGKGATDSYKTIVGFRVELPLGRGKGLLAASAAEKSAVLNHEASVATVAHEAANSVHESMVAYWRLVGAERRLEAKKQSLEMHQQLLETTRGLVDSGQMPRSELARELAREAEAQAAVEDAQRTLDEMRIDLAKKIGIQVNELPQAPYPSDDFPTPPDPSTLGRLDASVLGAYALSYRSDLRAAKVTQSASKVMWEAAIVDLARKTDLKLEVSTSGKDEENVVAKGLSGSMTGWSGPTAKADIALEWPIANDTQTGKMQQKKAQFAQEWIKMSDLDRSIRSQIVQTVAALQTESRGLDELRQALEYYDESVSSEIEKFRNGLTTLVDLISTEQRQLDARLAFVASQQRLAEFLSDLRFYTATLVVEQGGGFDVETDITDLPDTKRVMRPRTREQEP